MEGNRHIIAIKMNGTKTLHHEKEDPKSTQKIAGVVDLTRFLAIANKRRPYRPFMDVIGK
jgi:hypothetical protein